MAKGNWDENERANKQFNEMVSKPNQRWAILYDNGLLSC